MRIPPGIEEGRRERLEIVDKRVIEVRKESYFVIKCPELEDRVGRGVSYVVHWKCEEQFGEEIFKISLSIYNKDILQVSLTRKSQLILVPGERCELSAVDA